MTITIDTNDARGGITSPKNRVFTILVSSMFLVAFSWGIVDALTHLHWMTCYIGLGAWRQRLWNKLQLLPKGKFSAHLHCHGVNGETETPGRMRQLFDWHRLQATNFYPCNPQPVRASGCPLSFWTKTRSAIPLSGFVDISCLSRPDNAYLLSQLWQACALQKSRCYHQIAGDDSWPNADVYFGRVDHIMQQWEWVKQNIINERCLQYRKHGA